MRLPDRYQDLAARCDPLLAQMGMPKEQREDYLADLIGLTGQILDGYFRELARPPEPPRKIPSPDDAIAPRDLHFPFREDNLPDNNQHNL